jgi:phospholipid/cholesterol/gamma-HCH transport system ATP-binding protein
MEHTNHEPPIAVENLRKAFGRQQVLNGLSLQVQAGETMAVLGRSGTGKSVLLKVLIGLQAPDGGSVHIHGQDISQLAPRQLNEIRKRVGFLFQQAALYDSLTVAENVDFPLSRHSKLPDAERKEKVRELLAGMGMEKDMEKFPSEISGGMQKRVGLARALALDPDILLFDEPTSGLDPITADEIGRLIASLRDGRETTAVVVTHDVRAARLYSDRFVLIHEGKLVIEGKFEELRKSRNELVAQFLQGPQVR